MMHWLLGHTGKTRVEKTGERTVIYDYNRHKRGRLTKRALLCYLTTPVVQNLNGETMTRFSNSGIALSWGQVLNEMGYTVDIIEWNDTDFTPQDQYDLVIFHGGHNFAHISKYLAGQPKIIHFLTGSYWKFNNEQEDARRSDFKKRHGVETPRDRYISVNEDPVNEAADGIIVLGDPSMRGTYPASYRKIVTINNASYPDDHFDTTVKDYKTARKNFLFFAGSGNIHKGLDLLVDAFQSLDEHLYIMTVLDKAVMDALKKELSRPNIHVIGEIPMRTPPFYEVVDSCAFVITPSCSEGQAGSVVECMNQGLIPIVSKETRLDARGYGAVLSQNTIPEIQATVRHFGALPARDVEAMARKTRGIAISEHSPASFCKELRQAIIAVLG
jgi:glycosyltransferase involved in cell wall biosynthesis